MLFFKQQLSKSIIAWILLIGLCSSALHATTDVVIEKSPNDNRQYQGLYLDNGLRVLLVSDPSADIAAAALNVEAGSFNEMGYRNGLAHFLEHMLFLGTEKYPNPDEYSTYISAHGGSDNAWTSDRNTQYYFSIVPDHLAGALDRFAQFFIAPLLNTELVDRERHAVDSEYQLSIKQDGRRINAVDKATSNPKHPLSQFSIGNIKTLGDSKELQPIRESLLDFYRDYYSADRMVLAIVAPQSIVELEKIVIEAFSPISKHTVKDNSTDLLAYTPQETGKQIEVQTLGDYRELSLVFPIPSQHDKYTTRSLDYIVYLLQQRGAGSLYAQLKAQDWITDLSAGYDETTKSQDTAQISLSLTPNGLKHTTQIVATCFAYLNFLRDSGPQEAIFNELRLAGERNFIYAEKMDPSAFAANLPMAMQHYPLAKVLRAGGITQDTQFSPEDIKQLFAYFNPTNMRLFVLHKNVKGTKLESWYNVKYNVQSFSKAQLQAWQTPNVKTTFSLPAPNNFMPTNFKLLPADRPVNDYTAPTEVIAQPGLSLWYKQDSSFKLPLQNIFLLLRAPDMMATAKDALLFKFMVYTYNENLLQSASSFSLAGVTVAGSATAQGLQIMINMFSDKQSAVLQQTLEYLQNYKIDKIKFAAYKDDIKRDLLNFKQQLPFRQAGDKLSSILKDPAWSAEDLLPHIDSLTLQDLEKYTQRFLEQIQILAFVHGNISSQDAQNLISTAAKQLQINTTRTTNLVLPKFIQLANSTQLLYTFNPHHNDAAIVSYYQAATKNDQTVAVNSLLVNLMSRPLYTQLRTTEQLGYVVAIDEMRARDQAGVILYIESPAQKPDFLLERFKVFLQNYQPLLASFSQEELQIYKDSLVAVWLQKPNSLSEESVQDWIKMLDGTLRFNYNQDIAAEIAKLQLPDVISYFDSLWFVPASNRNLMVTTKDHSPKIPNQKLIKDIQSFKLSADYQL